MKLGFVQSKPARLVVPQVGSADLRAGWLSAIIMLPQAVILSTLAGLPAEMGVYASLFAVIVAALLGKSPRLLSGPNTTLCVMIASSLVPLATPASSEYVALALVLTAIVGVIQILAALLKLGKLFEIIPEFIVQGVTIGVGLVIISSQLPTIFGILAVPGQAPWMYVWHTIFGLDHANWLAVTISLVSILVGWLFMHFKFRLLPPLIASLVAGTGLAFFNDTLFGCAVGSLERVGHLSLSLLPMSLPVLQMDEMYIFKQLLVSAIAIAFMGALQTIIIARWISNLDQTPVRPNRELMAQGAANIVAAFTSGFAGSGSFNRSAAHVNAGAKTSRAAVMSAGFLMILVYALEPMMSYLPTAAMAGTLSLIGWNLMRSAYIGAVKGGADKAALCIVAVCVVAAGLEAAVFWSCLFAIANYIWRYTQRP